MKTTRAKFTCEEVTKNGDEGQTVHLTPVTSGSVENESFFDMTPFGMIELGIVNPAVQFEVGKEYYVDFSIAE